MVLFSRYIIVIICSVLDPDTKEVAVKSAVYRGPRRGGTSFYNHSSDWMFYGVTQKLREEAVTHSFLPNFPDTKDLIPPGKYSV